MVHNLSLSSIIFNLVKFNITIIDRFITMKRQPNNDRLGELLWDTVAAYD